MSARGASSTPPAARARGVVPPAHPQARQPWWRTGVMWLVVGGPLVVVVAGIVTAVIALQGADDILDAGSAARGGSQAPALKARNHAATPAQR